VKKSKIKPPPNWEDTPQSFERFERLAQALIAVPKHEIEPGTGTKHEATRTGKLPTKAVGKKRKRV